MVPHDAISLAPSRSLEQSGRDNLHAGVGAEARRLCDASVGEAETRAEAFAGAERRPPGAFPLVCAGDARIAPW